MTDSTYRDSTYRDRHASICKWHPDSLVTVPTPIETGTFISEIFAPIETGTFISGIFEEIFEQAVLRGCVFTFERLHEY
jgi:hypothetical protein